MNLRNIGPLEAEDNPPVSASVRVASFSLMSYSEDANYVERRIETIEGKVPGCSLGDDQFPNVSIDAPPDEGMRFQDANGASDVQERLLGSLRRSF